MLLKYIEVSIEYFVVFEKYVWIILLKKVILYLEKSIDECGEEKLFFCYKKDFNYSMKYF